MFVTDMHPLAHYALGKFPKLGRRSLRLFREAEDNHIVIHVPAAALWEITSLVRQGGVKLPLSFDNWCRQLESKRGSVIEPMDCLIA